MSEFRKFCIGATAAYAALFLIANLTGEAPKDGAALAAIMVMVLGGVLAVALFGNRA